MEKLRVREMQFNGKRLKISVELTDFKTFLGSNLKMTDIELNASKEQVFLSLIYNEIKRSKTSKINVKSNLQNALIGAYEKFANLELEGESDSISWDDKEIVNSKFSFIDSKKTA